LGAVRISYQINFYVLDLFVVANSALDIQYGWRLGNNRSVSFDTRVLLSQFDLIRYPQYDESTDINGRMYIVYQN
jgi:hypothetical protein